MRIFLLIVFLFYYANLYSQTKEVSGVIIDKEDHRPIAGVILQMQGARNFALTANDGTFTLKYNTPDTTLQIQCMGYQSQLINTRDLMSFVTIQMTQQPTRLNDVIIKAPDISQRNDTLIYQINRYAQVQDRNIADVLKRLPGIKVEDNGEIKYNGEPINKFYIDGSDFMDGRYGFATENISPEDVARVEILENHQPTQVLNGLEFSQQAGLNIRLKEQAKLRWIGILNGGIGTTPLLYDASAFAMRIAGKWQSAETFRTNNTGWNPKSQSKIHSTERIFGNDYREELWQDYIYVGQSSAPLDENRTRNNQSYLANTTNSWHIADGYDVKLNLTYEGDRLKQATGNHTNYLDPDIAPFSELNNLSTQSHLLNGQWGLHINRPNLYIKDNLYVDANWHNAVSNITGSLSLTQKSETPSLSVRNDLQLIKRINYNLLTISSRNSYTYKPYSLDVYSGDSIVTQRTTSGDFRSTTEARYGWLRGRWNIYARAGIDLNLHNMESDLSGIKIAYPTQGNERFTSLNTYASPEASYQSSRWTLTLSLPVGYRLYETKSHIGISPSAYVRHQINAKTDITVQAKYALIPPDLNTYINTILMMDFRNLYLNNPTSESTEERSIAAAIRYRNPITSLFANFSSRYQWNYAPTMQNQLFISDRILTTFAQVGNNYKAFQVNGGISKGIVSGKISIGLNVGYMQVWAVTMRQNQISPYTLQSLNIQPTLKGQFSRWFSADYKLTYSYNDMNIKSSGANSYNTLKQLLNLTFIPDKNWLISVGGEHYQTKFNSGSSTDLLLIDASLSWKISKHTELRLTAANLLDKKEYRYANYGLLSETEYTYAIRGRSLMANVQIKL